MKIGDPVTVVARRPGALEEFPVLAARIVAVNPKGSMTLEVHLEGFPHGRGQIVYALDEEGTFWAQGHSGPAVDALRAAQALV